MQRFISRLVWLTGVVLATTSTVRADDVVVTGSTSGSVWGSGPYTSDSDIGTAAVHAGLIGSGQTAIIRVTSLGTQTSFTGSTANGVTTYSWASYEAINISLVSSGGGGGGASGGPYDPNVYFYAPSPAQFTKGESVIAYANVSDGDHDLRGSGMSWDGATIVSNSHGDSSSDDLIAYISSSSAGVKTLRAWGYDSRDANGTPNQAGYSAAEMSVNVIDSNADPAFAIFSPTVASSAIRFDFRVTDADGDLSVVDFYASFPPAYNGAHLVASKGVSGGDVTTSQTWQPPYSGAYHVYAVVRDSNWASAQSSTITISVTVPAPSAPTNLVVSNLAPTSFTLGWNPSATGVVAAYRVTRDGTSLGEVTGTSMNLTGLTAGQSYIVTVAARDGGGSWSTESAPLVVTTPAPPTITIQPQPATAAVGASANFSVVATGAPPLSYQWQKNGVAISGATSATYSIASVSATDAATYGVIVSNAWGSVTSAGATLTVNTVNLQLQVHRPQ